MNDTTSQATPSNILHTEKIGRVRYDIEEFEGKNGRFYSTRFYRIYKKEDDFEKAYSFATSERADDLEDLSRATAAASNWIRLQLETSSEAAA